MVEDIKNLSQATEFEQQEIFWKKLKQTFNSKTQFIIIANSNDEGDIAKLELIQRIKNIHPLDVVQLLDEIANEIETNFEGGKYD